MLSEQTTELGCGRPSGQNIKPGLKPQNNNKNGKRNRKILKSWWWILKNTLNIIPKKVPVSISQSLKKEEGNKPLNQVGTDSATVRTPSLQTQGTLSAT